MINKSSLKTRIKRLLAAAMVAGTLAGAPMKASAQAKIKGKPVAVFQVSAKGKAFSSHLRFMTKDDDNINRDTISELKKKAVAYAEELSTLIEAALEKKEFAKAIKYCKIFNLILEIVEPLPGSRALSNYPETVEAAMGKAALELRTEIEADLSKKDFGKASDTFKILDALFDVANPRQSLIIAKQYKLVVRIFKRVVFLLKRSETFGLPDGTYNGRTQNWKWSLRIKGADSEFRSKGYPIEMGEFAEGTEGSPLRVRKWLQKKYGKPLRGPHPKVKEKGGVINTIKGWFGR